MSEERTENINSRIYKRNIPSQSLEPNINVRPVSTKYSIFPMVDLRRRAKPPLLNYPSYTTRTYFNPSDRKAPVEGYNPMIESSLRNQFFAIQRANQAIYVPEKNSDLYNVKYVNSNAPPPTTDRQLLFINSNENLSSDDRNPYQFKTDGFNNSTRSYKYLIP